MITYDHYMSFYEIGFGEHCMNTITLDFSGIKSYWELHEYLKDIFQLPDYYGHNMDALWDCLYCCYDCSTTFVLKNLSAIPTGLTPEIKIMLELFRDLAQKDGVNIVIEYAEAFDSSDYLI